MTPQVSIDVYVSRPQINDKKRQKCNSFIIQANKVNNPKVNSDFLENFKIRIEGEGPEGAVIVEEG